MRFSQVIVMNFTTLMQFSLRYNKIALSKFIGTRFLTIMTQENDIQKDVSPGQDETAKIAQEARQKRVEASRNLLAKLSEEYPAIFPHPKDGRPVALAIGIHKQLIPIITEWGFSAVNLRSALSWYTKQLRYQQAIVHAEHRLNLDGTAAEVIDEEHRTLAKENVERIQALLAKKRPQRAKREEERPRKVRNNKRPKTAKPTAKKAVKDTRSLDEKMQSLLNKFNQ